MEVLQIMLRENIWEKVDYRIKFVSRIVTLRDVRKRYDPHLEQLYTIVVYQSSGNLSYRVFVPYLRASRNTVQLMMVSDCVKAKDG